MKKIGILIFVLLLALSCLGVGYAWWTQTLTINGEVNTGDLEATVYAVTNDSGVNLDPISGSWSNITWNGTASSGYNAASTSASVSGDILTVTLTDAYPGYKSSVAVRIYNSGTVPIKAAASDWYNPSTPDGASIDDLDVDFSGWDGTTVIDSGAYGYAYVDIEVGDVPETGTYSADLKIVFYQYNGPTPSITVP